MDVNTPQLHADVPRSPCRSFVPYRHGLRDKSLISTVQPPRRAMIPAMQSFLSEVDDAGDAPSSDPMGEDEQEEFEDLLEQVANVQVCHSPNLVLIQSLSKRLQSPQRPAAKARLLLCVLDNVN